MGRSKADGVLDRLGRQVVAGRFLPGGRVPTEEELVRRLRISRPSVREGLKALVRKGLVESRARRGTVVRGRENWDILDPDVLRWMAAAPPDYAFLMSLIELRAIMEPAAARLAAQRATPAQILSIERAFRGMVASLPQNIEACHRHDLAFHEGIFAASGNAMLFRFYTAISTVLLTLFRASTEARESYERSLDEHGAVAAAIGRREPEAAEKAMRGLLAGTARDLEPAFRPRMNSKRKPKGGSKP
jgi:DNA-binding FadR family transcriptional regulator